MYQELILDHSRTPHGYGLRDEIPAQSHQLNPTCGDEITLQVHRGDDGTIDAIAWEGHGCAISQASASLLAELAEGLSVPELEVRIAAFRDAMRSRGTIAPDEELLGDAAALGGVSKYVARVKCAMLAWVATEDALTRL
ncbi:SUF system NifU family Fe-S cluster assembly protein [Aneurinibacillus sp. BA2021]|nr:SUF system NifU family Fe-S cluster assembly protein [Aneurinibacillus sp. BA2021]